MATSGAWTIVDTGEARRTTEVFLAKADGTTVDHGGVDDLPDAAGVKRPFVANAMDELLAKKPLTVATSALEIPRRRFTSTERMGRFTNWS
jgi:hypothetical protein